MTAHSPFLLQSLTVLLTPNTNSQDTERGEGIAFLKHGFVWDPSQYVQPTLAAVS